jgi:hypothetical protein
MTLLVSGARSSKYTAPGFTPKGGDSVTTRSRKFLRAKWYRRTHGHIRSWKDPEGF